MFMCRFIGVVAVFILLPHAAAASVIINEIAWMGSSDSANREWIELHNNGTAPQSLDGWMLKDGQSLEIELAGTIAAGSYAVLERTSDDTAPGTAFLIYTGALTNIGATLRLYNESGGLADQVAGGDNWELIGGDNVTKETAQLTTSGWMTAEATPGAANSTAGRAPGSNESTTSSRSSGNVIARPVVETRKLIPSTNQLALSLIAPTIVYVNQEISLEALPSAIGETIAGSLHYEWNFGDLATGTGKRVKHTHQYPGEYLVTVRAHYARHDIVTEYLLKVLPVRFSLAQTSDGDMQINNDSPYDIDVSGFALAGTKTQKFPPCSRIAKNGTITVPQAAFGGAKLGQVYLHDATGSIVASLTPAPTVVAASNPVVEKSVTAPLITVPIANAADGASDEAFTFANELDNVSEPEAAVVTEEEVLVAEEAATFAAAAITANATPTAELWPLAGLLGIIMLGLAGVYFGAQKT